MASNYPTSLDNFTNPSAGASLSSPSHSTQHGDVNDAIEAIEAKLGIGSSAASAAVNGAVLVANGSGTTTYSSTGYGVYTAYTPTYTNVTVGNGTSAFRYTQINKLVHVEGRFTLGTTSAITGAISMTLPVTVSANYNRNMGSVSLQDAGVLGYMGFANLKSSTEVFLFALNTAGTYLSESVTSATVPFTWGNTDYFAINLVYEAA